MNPFLETVVVEWNVALLTQIDALHVLLSVERALLAVAPLRLALRVKLRGNRPVVEPVKPGHSVLHTGIATFPRVDKK